MKKIVLLNLVTKNHEPYDRNYLLGEVARYCYRNPSILCNAGMTSVWARGYLGHERRWENHCKWVSCVCFEIDEITEAKWKFLEESIGSWAIELKVLPDDWETTIIYPSEFQQTS